MTSAGEGGGGVNLTVVCLRAQLSRESREGRPIWQMSHLAHVLAEEEDNKPNPVTQRVKIIMVGAPIASSTDQVLCLNLIYPNETMSPSSLWAWPWFTPTPASQPSLWGKTAQLPWKDPTRLDPCGLRSSPGEETHTHTRRRTHMEIGSNTVLSPPLSVELEHVITLGLALLLAVKYVLFEQAETESSLSLRSPISSSPPALKPPVAEDCCRRDLPAPPTRRSSSGVLATSSSSSELSASPGEGEIHNCVLQV